LKTTLELFRDNFFREPIEIAGLRLVPFTLGHAIILDQFGIKAIQTPADLFIGILVCSTSPREFERGATSRIFSLWVHWVAWRCNRRWRDQDAFLRSAQLFNEYLEEQTACPDYDIVGDTAEIEGGVPFVQHLRAVLLSKLNYSPEKVMDATFTQAHWDYCAWLEMERAIKVLDGKRGENNAARFSDADAMHAARVKRVMELRGHVNGHSS
jgi:hypothetical protein